MRSDRLMVSSTMLVGLAEHERFAGDWTDEGIGAALDRALADPEVDVVPTFGLLSSHHAAHRAALPNVVDPLRDGKSGRRNFSYVANFQSVRNEVRTFHRILRFKHMADLVDGPTMTAIPDNPDRHESCHQRSRVWDAPRGSQSSGLAPPRQLAGSLP